MDALSLNNIQYTYRSEFLRRKMSGLSDVNLTIAQGESFGFLGHNGAGKTTTIKCILDICRITAGTISVFGVPHTEVAARKEIGFLPEQPYFYDNLTVKETLALYGKLTGLSKPRLKTRIDELITQLGLTHKVNARIKSLSKGLMQRVGMAQAIIAEPKLLILDEPFSGLDPLGRKLFRTLLLSLKEKGTTLFLSSHILNDVEVLCDRASIMAHGTIKGVFDLKKLAHENRSLEEIFVSLVSEEV